MNWMLLTHLDEIGRLRPPEIAVDVSEAIAFYWEGTPVERFDPAAFGCVVAPAPVVWMEAVPPEYPNTGGVRLPLGFRNRLRRFGWMIVRRELTPSERDKPPTLNPLARSAFPIDSDDLERTVATLDVAGAAPWWVQSITGYSWARTGVLLPDFTVFDWLDSRGRVLISLRTGFVGVTGDAHYAGTLASAAYFALSLVAGSNDAHLDAVRLRVKARASARVRHVVESVAFSHLRIDDPRSLRDRCESIALPLPDNTAPDRPETKRTPERDSQGTEAHEGDPSESDVDTLRAEHLAFISARGRELVALSRKWTAEFGRGLLAVTPQKLAVWKNVPDELLTPIFMTRSAIEESIGADWLDEKLDRWLEDYDPDETAILVVLFGGARYSAYLVRAEPTFRPEYG